MLPELLCVVALTAAPPAGERIEAAISDFETRAAAIDETGYAPDALRAAADEILADLDLSEASLTQIRRLVDGRVLGCSKRLFDAMDRLGTLAASPDLPGYEAAQLRVRLAGYDFEFDDPGKHDGQIAMCRAALRHPALEEALVSGRAERLPRIVSRSFQWPVCDATRPDLLALEPLLTESLPDATVVQLFELIRVMAPRISDRDRAEYERFHARVARLFRVARDRLDADDPQRIRLERQIEFMDGAFAQARLFGHEAPDLKAVWSSTTDAPTFDLDDLRGQVVILEFWTTWCTSCIAGFPEIRRFVEHYRDAPVVVLGVSWVQGFHITSDSRRIECEGDPDREFALMRERMREIDVTWPVVFAGAGVPRNGYGVIGIPDTVVIGPDGRVVTKQFSFRDLARASRQVDDLLRKHGLPVPPAPR